MSDGLNRATIIGNLVADPTLRFTQAGQAVLSFRVAASESYADKNGERQERTEFISCVLWGKRAEGLSKILEKGKQLYIEGRIQTRSWEDKDGGKRYATEINASDIKLLGGGSGQRDGGQRGPREPAQSGGYDGGGDDEDSAPF